MRSAEAQRSDYRWEDPFNLTPNKNKNKNINHIKCGTYTESVTRLFNKWSFILLKSLKPYLINSLNMGIFISFKF